MAIPAGGGGGDDTWEAIVGDNFGEYNVSGIPSWLAFINSFCQNNNDWIRED